MNRVAVQRAGAIPAAPATEKAEVANDRHQELRAEDALLSHDRREQSPGASAGDRDHAILAVPRRRPVGRPAGAHDQRHTQESWNQDGGSQEQAEEGMVVELPGRQTDDEPGCGIKRGPGRSARGEMTVRVLEADLFRRFHQTDFLPVL